MRTLTTALAALALLGLPTPSSAAPTLATRLDLSVSRPDGTATTVSLTCHPPGGSHPRADAACADLATARGDLDHLPARNGICPMIFRPVTARASGRWRGEPVNWQREFGNSCALANVTGQVFALSPAYPTTR